MIQTSLGSWKRSKHGYFQSLKVGHSPRSDKCGKYWDIILNKPSVFESLKLSCICKTELNAKQMTNGICYQIFSAKLVCLFFFFFIWVLRPFQEYFTYIASPKGLRVNSPIRKAMGACRFVCSVCSFKAKSTLLRSLNLLKLFLGKLSILSS